MAKLPYDKETGALISLFNDLDNPQSIEDLDFINAKKWFAELKRDQAAFEDALTT